MRIGRIKQLTDKPAPEVRIDLDALRARRARELYAKGLEDGSLIALDMIEGKARHGGVPYDGPLPDELREYIARVRENARG